MGNNDKEKLRHKKVNQLNIEEANKVLDMLGQSNQETSKKCKHVKEHIERIQANHSKKI